MTGAVGKAGPWAQALAAANPPSPVPRAAMTDGLGPVLLSLVALLANKQGNTPASLWLETENGDMRCIRSQGHPLALVLSRESRRQQAQLLTLTPTSVRRSRTWTIRPWPPSVLMRASRVPWTTRNMSARQSLSEAGLAPPPANSLSPPPAGDHPTPSEIANLTQAQDALPSREGITIFAGLKRLLLPYSRQARRRPALHAIARHVAPWRRSGLPWSPRACHCPDAQPSLRGVPS